MFDERNADDERGQVGIGTLIVFIAMVLVAAIAAGVLINTAGFLQDSAEDTGQESGDQVTDRLQVVNSVGDEISSNGVDTATLTVSKSPGAGAIDLEDVTIGVVGPDASDTLTYDASSAGADSFTTAAIDGSGTVVTGENNMHKITISLSDLDATDANLQEGESATLRLTTDSAATTIETISVPESVSGTSAVNL